MAESGAPKSRANKGSSETAIILVKDSTTGLYLLVKTGTYIKKKDEKTGKYIQKNDRNELSRITKNDFYHLIRTDPFFPPNAFLKTPHKEYSRVYVPNSWGFVKGKIRDQPNPFDSGHPNETDLEGAKRELGEETGLDGLNDDRFHLLGKLNGRKNPIFFISINAEEKRKMEGILSYRIQRREGEVFDYDFSDLETIFKSGLNDQSERLCELLKEEGSIHTKFNHLNSASEVSVLGAPALEVDLTSDPKFLEFVARELSAQGHLQQLSAQGPPQGYPQVYPQQFQQPPGPPYGYAQGPPQQEYAQWSLRPPQQLSAQGPPQVYPQQYQPQQGPPQQYQPPGYPQVYPQQFQQPPGPPYGYAPGPPPGSSQYQGPPPGSSQYQPPGSSQWQPGRGGAKTRNKKKRSKRRSTANRRSD